ncbi:copper ABC transporter substrate-binding protein [Haloferax mediterranei ATCC 33500]|uniref:Copper ABC transporter substrate-binding protein n=1 Tax=Haloferax mediterranei (strain ATCC 33500 / DSM 1411 / JCM 8866 / NBRC 14739 / NCIMB 2177 / R-4) TaxID=523841 RepID=I3R2X7_HALMT|nr:NosD domain-containing protein [Haloferax mediterranei]AFK18587.2 copper-binding protein [Haloferax mediterranei ATCC 33500]AHZ22039.1 copper ABC transporter substrate-binding protein [Haloferax mediterranei ATCC 33500]EMA02138.1 copper-binding protein [Haloferax mediterranei ATCC 33500]MDX5988675.1 NosD domain-containing protein [Haloferax mediterranei ATCC 33500]QCQ75087.1 copper ABC transporter substrate-binding protein [Haloferax mediterranei ATCC 33500]
MALVTPTATRWTAAAVALVFVLASVSFVVPATGTVSPVPFDDTVKTGGTSVDILLSDGEGFEVPVAQVHFSRYRYVIGYYDVTTAAADISTSESARQFGDPLAVFVTDYATVTPALGEDNYLRTENNRTPGWVKASEASFVVDSGARVPSGPIAVPFSDADAAQSFADEHGGEVIDWRTLQDRTGSPLSSRLAAFESSVKSHHDWANQTVAASDSLFDRPVSTVVGEDAPTVEAAVESAPNGTAVYVPAGTYSVESVDLNRSITLVGAGTETALVDDGNDTAVHIRADRAAVANLSISGVGDVGTRRIRVTNESVDWDTRVQLAYGRGDTGIVLDGANGSAVRNVRIDTPASGVIVRESASSVLDNLTVQGAEDPSDGFMGVVLIGERSVVEDSTFLDGRDGVYTHRADGSVVRNNHMEDGRYGVHEMYTSDMLVADNVVRENRIGVIIMTRPVGNLVVGNDVQDSNFGFIPAGSDTYVADNVFANNEYGMDVSGDRQVYVRNVVAGNEIGVRGSSTFPTNVVVRNDIVDNDVQVESALGPMRTWTREGDGNYWGDLPLEDADGDGVYDRAFQPSGPVDAELGRSPTALVLSRSPVMDALRRARDDVAGLRGSGVVDAASRTEPVQPDVLARVNATGEADV